MVDSRLTSLLALVVSIVGVAALWWTQPKVGYVDSAILIERYAGAAAARDSFAVRNAEWSGNEETLRAELVAMNERLRENAATLGPVGSRPLQDSLARKQEELARYSRAVAAQRTELDAALMAPVFEEINARVKDFGEDEGFDIIFGTVQGGSILYGAPAADVTERLLDALHADQ